MSIDGIANIGMQNISSIAGSSNISEQLPKVTELDNNSSFFHVFKETCGDTFLATTKYGNIGGNVNHLNSPEDISKILNEQRYTKIEQNPNLPSYLKINTFA